MVMLVWWILSLFEVCTFTWLPVAIDCGLGALLLLSISPDNYASNTLCLIPAGFFFFAFCKHFLSLSISGWWILVSPIWFAIASLLPGGYTITNIVMEKCGLMALPTWVLIVGILFDILMAIGLIAGYIADRRAK